MKQIHVVLYIIFFISALQSENEIYIWSMVALGVVCLLSIPIYRKIRVNIIKNGIEKKNIKLNVNKAQWWELQELPYFNRVSAKLIIWNRNHNGPYTDFSDFFIKNSIAQAHAREELKTLIKFK